jgi:hypothetical protein
MLVLPVLLLPSLPMLLLLLILPPLFSLPLLLQPGLLQKLLQRGRYRPRNRPQLTLTFNLTTAAQAGAAASPDRGAG